MTVTKTDGTKVSTETEISVTDDMWNYVGVSWNKYDGRLTLMVHEEDSTALIGQQSINGFSYNTDVQVSTYKLHKRLRHW